MLHFYWSFSSDIMAVKGLIFVAGGREPVWPSGKALGW